MYTTYSFHRSLGRWIRSFLYPALLFKATRYGGRGQGLAWLTLQMYTEGKMMSERGDVVDSMLVTVPELTKDSTFWKRSLTGTPLNRLLLF